MWRGSHKQTHKRQHSGNTSRHCGQPSQHGSCEHMFMCADAIHPEYGGAMVRIRGNAEDMPHTDNAYWNGAHSCSNTDANCFASIRATNGLKEHPVAIARTPPSGFVNAVRRVGQDSLRPRTTTRRCRSGPTRSSGIRKCNTQALGMRLVARSSNFSRTSCDRRQVA